MKEELTNLRNKLDNFDKEIVQLLQNRLDISGEIIRHKLAAGLPVWDKKREESIIRQIRNDYSGSLSAYLIENVFREIFKESKKRFYPIEHLDLNKVLERKPYIIAGPCVVESREQIESIADKIAALGLKLLRGGAFKPRTNPNSFQGLGREGMEYLKEAASKRGLYTVSEVLDEKQIEEFYDCIDIVQIGSRSMSSYGFLKNIGKITSKTQKPVILKRGFASTLNEFLHAADYIRSEGNPNVILCLRGIRTFEQIDSEMRNTPDLAGILELKSKTDLPVIFDPSHSTGNSKYVVQVSKAALMLGADGLLIESHIEPEKALIDGLQSIKPEQLRDILEI